MNRAAIKPIDTWSIDQITSGQVITSISSAVKELVENSIDANGTVIEVKLMNHGRDGFRVQDNGTGVDEADFEFLAHKHATSKIEQFSDLASVNTLGFRGEALASLCALAKVTIITSTGGGYGYELEMNSDGTVKNKSKTATPKGTIVIVNDLFYGLPVRRKDFERNYMREYTKVVSVMQEYALLSSARITVEHVNKNRTSLILKSQGAEMLQRIACVYGFKRTKMLCKLSFTSSELNEQFKSLNGYISKPAFGMGDSAATCQLIAINSRPSHQPRLAKMIIDVYKQFNLTETPFFVINLAIDTNQYDVNISPDKRSLLLHKEETIIENVRKVLFNFFGGMDHTVPRAVSDLPPAKKQKSKFLSFAAFSGTGTVINQNEKEQGEESDVVHQDYAASNDVDEECQVRSVEELKEHDITSSMNEYIKRELLDTGIGKENHSDNLQEHQNDKNMEPESTNDSTRNGTITEDREEVDKEQANHDENEKETSTGAQSSTTLFVDESEDTVSTSIEDIKKEMDIDCIPAHINDITADETDGNPPDASVRDVDSSLQNYRPTLQQVNALNTHIHLPLTIQSISSVMKAEAKHKTDNSRLNLQNLSIDEEGVEERLQLSISKNDFETMEVIGQFNLGFILVVNRKSNHDDLFVIDQHASDEIYNFERLQKYTVLSRQPLIVPHKLELSAVEELTIQQHMSIFENNGFTISIHENEPPGQQCFLESVPYSKSTIFDDKDVFELLSKVKEDPNNKDLRCSKLRAMFAMRACRSSIMVGRPLDMNTMRKVVKHLGTLDKPWNCPHGRPTLRHITSLS